MTDTHFQRLLFAGHSVLLCGTLLVTRLTRSSDESSWNASSGVEGVLVAQVTLIAMWATLSSRSLLFRAVAMTILVPLLGAMGCSLVMPGFLVRLCAEFRSYLVHPRQDFRDGVFPYFAIWLNPLAILCACTIVCLSAARLAGIRLTTVAQPEHAQHRPRQLSLLHLFGWLTFACALSAVARVMMHLEMGLIDWFDLKVLTPVVLYTYVGLATSLLVLCERRNQRIVIGLASVVVFVGVFQAAEDGRLPHPATNTLGSLVLPLDLTSWLMFALTIAATLAWCRYRGYRIGQCASGSDGTDETDGTDGTDGT